MRWSCPHCGIRLALSDEKLGASWSFSQCYKCGGFALVRKSDVNLVKVDKAPPGETVVLPEGAEEATHVMMNQKAAKNLAKISTDKPVIRPSIRQKFSQSTQIESSSQIPEQANFPPRFSPKIEAVGMSVEGLPEPLGEPPINSGFQRYLPIAIGVAALMAIGSGIYLFQQGQALWEKTRAAATTEHHTFAENTTQIQTPSLPTQNMEMTDQVHQNAMAPARTPEVEAPAPNLTKEIQAPSKAAESAKIMTAPVFGYLLIQPKLEKINIHSGPGVGFPIIATAGSRYQYAVTDWNERWFKIQILAKNQDGRYSQNYGWVRNDLVQHVAGPTK